MIAVEVILMMALILPIILAMSWVREALRLVEPTTRLGFGIVAFLGSAAALFLTVILLPGPAAIEGDLLLMTLLMWGMSIFAGGFVLSFVLVSSAAWQAFKRWKFYRSNGS